MKPYQYAVASTFVAIVLACGAAQKSVVLPIPAPSAQKRADSTIAGIPGYKLIRVCSQYRPEEDRYRVAVFMRNGASRKQLQGQDVRIRVIREQGGGTVFESAPLDGSREEKNDGFCGQTEAGDPFMLDRDELHYQPLETATERVHLDAAKEKYVTRLTCETWRSTPFSSSKTRELDCKEL